MSHDRVIPTGCAPDRLAYTSPETARKWGRRMYGARGYRLIQCGGACSEPASALPSLGAGVRVVGPPARGIVGRFRGLVRAQD